MISCSSSFSEWIRFKRSCSSHFSNFSWSRRSLIFCTSRVLIFKLFFASSISSSSLAQILSLSISSSSKRNSTKNSSLSLLSPLIENLSYSGRCLSRICWMIAFADWISSIFFLKYKILIIKYTPNFMNGNSQTILPYKTIDI